MSALDLSTLHGVLALADAASSLRDAAATLRQQLAPLRVAVVDAMDMRDETPAASSPRHHLYLGHSDGHCWAMTADPAKASGLFIAARA